MSQAIFMQNDYANFEPRLAAMGTAWGLYAGYNLGQSIAKDNPPLSLALTCASAITSTIFAKTLGQVLDNLERTPQSREKRLYQTTQMQKVVSLGLAGYGLLCLADHVNLFPMPFQTPNGTFFFLISFCNTTPTPLFGRLGMVGSIWTADTLSRIENLPYKGLITPITILAAVVFNTVGQVLDSSHEPEDKRKWVALNQFKWVVFGCVPFLAHYILKTHPIPPPQTYRSLSQK